MTTDSTSYDALDSPCPAHALLDLIASKWTPMIVYSLRSGPSRFSELQRQIGGISQKMLAQTLRKLESDGLVRRTVHPNSPPRVDYALTEEGQTLVGPLQALCDWVAGYLERRRAAEAEISELSQNGVIAESAVTHSAVNHTAVAGADVTGSVPTNPQPPKELSANGVAH